MRRIRAKNSMPVKPWVRSWMVWPVFFMFIFVPSFLIGLFKSPYYCWLEAWDDFKIEYDPLDFRK